MPTKFRSRTLRKLFLLGKYWRLWKGIWKQKHEHTFLELVQELDKVERDCEFRPLSLIY
jgi:hypothetical protein